jgi:hypothetical protein
MFCLRGSGTVPTSLAKPWLRTSLPSISPQVNSYNMLMISCSAAPQSIKDSNNIQPSCLIFWDKRDTICPLARLNSLSPRWHRTITTNCKALLVSLPVPTTMAEILSFLGLAGYIRA